jgi:uncharacterized membrane protein YedE/YeeE
MHELYWPWWVSSIGLGVITIGFALMFKRPLGTSGSWTRVVTWRNDKIIEKAEAPFRDSPQVLEDALMKATIEEFGEAKVKEVLDRRKGKSIAMPVLDLAKLPIRIPWTVHLTFLLMLIVGGFIASYFNGSFQVRYTLGEVHTHIFGTGMGTWLALIFGGALVGFGTQLGGGCTSGHGLSGCSRFVPASLVATIFYMVGGIVTSFLMEFSGIIGQ